MVNKIKLKKTWDYMFLKLCEFKKANNYCHIPVKHIKDSSLGLWVNRQRTQYKKGMLSQDQISKLEEINFIWNPNHDEWEKNFLELCKFKEAYAHCNVPRFYAENGALGRWVNNQR
ncbi:MAG: helicase associated domain-containing protein, partial [Candidatus Babeliales bacterium]